MAHRSYSRRHFQTTLTTILSLLLLSLAAPGPVSAADSKPETPAKTTPAVPIAPELKVADKFLLAIPKSGFGKDYLFTASLIPQEHAPTSTGLAGKIVRFELFPDGVDMYESTKGLVVTEDLPARRLLANFTIVRTDGDNVIIDFNKGMHRVFTQSWTEGSGFGGRDRVLDVPESRVFEMKQEEGRLTIRQSVQARNRQFDQNSEQRYEARYFISPYKAESFESKEPNIADSRYTKFFETDGQLETGTGRTATHIARFDIRKPVIFYYSANTPADYVEAVKDGILYWNRAFEKDVIQVKKAPDGVTAPDATHNIIQWVPWDNAGFAYADVLMEPLSGASQHGQAYITSVFGFGGKARARALLRAMEEIAEKKDEKKKLVSVSLGVPFMSSGPSCQIDPETFAEQMAHGLQEVLASDSLTDEAVLRVSQDYVREVVAHEVGHVLGLRHNFAGSLGVTLTRKELDDWFKAYITGKPLDAYTNKLSSTAMMEYTVFKGGAFIGWMMRASKRVLPHDHAAIQWGYFDKPEAREKKLLFATDQDIFRYGDVRQFDFGPDPVVNAYSQIAEIIDLLPNNLIETFIRARAPFNAKDRVPLELVNLSYTQYARELANEFADELQWFKSETRSVKVENDFDFIGDLNRKERYEAHWKALNTQIEQLSGVDRAVFSFLPLDLKLDLKKDPTNGAPVMQKYSATNLMAKLEKLLDSPNYKTFVGLDDKKYSFTKDEKELIIKRGKKFFEELDKELVKQVCTRLGNAPRTLGIEANAALADEDNISKLEQRIIEMAKLVVTARDETKKLKGKVDKANVEVADFKYDRETRLAAANALSDKTGSFKGWADEAKGELNTQLKNEVEQALNMEHFKDFKVSLLSRQLREWYQEQLEILGALPPAPGNPTLPAR